jgi:hypothetical protein
MTDDSKGLIWNREMIRIFDVGEDLRDKTQDRHNSQVQCFPPQVPILRIIRVSFPRDREAWLLLFSVWFGRHSFVQEGTQTKDSNTGILYTFNHSSLYSKQSRRVFYEFLDKSNVAKQIVVRFTKIARLGNPATSLSDDWLSSCGSSEFNKLEQTPKWALAKGN